VLLPRGEEGVRNRGLAPRLLSLRGKRIGFHDNAMWRSSVIVMQEFEQYLKQEFGIREVVPYSKTTSGGQPTPRAELEALVRKVDAVVLGLGN
jgi:hypothetical protein